MPDRFAVVVILQADETVLGPVFGIHPLRHDLAIDPDRVGLAEQVNS